MPLPDIQDAIDLIEQGQPSEAIPLLQAVAERMPTYVAVHAMTARAYEAGDQPEEALAAWERASFLMPNSPAVREGLVRTRMVSFVVHSSEEDRLRVDLDLQAELDAALETPFNPFALPPQSETVLEALDLGAEQPMTLAEASLALVERALSEAEIDTEDATEESVSQTEAAPDEEAETSQTLAARRALEAAAAQESPFLSSETEEDLDRLIDELGTARFVPQPDLDDLPPPELDDDIDDMVSETLARIYASQQQYGEAARVYEQLAIQQPDQAERFLAEAAAMRAQE